MVCRTRKTNGVGRIADLASPEPNAQSFQVHKRLARTLDTVNSSLRPVRRMLGAPSQLRLYNSILSLVATLNFIYITTPHLTLPPPVPASMPSKAALAASSPQV